MVEATDSETDRDRSDAKPEAEIKKIRDASDENSEEHDGIRYACQIVVDYINTPYKASYSYAYYPESQEITESESYYRDDGWEVRDLHPRSTKWRLYREISGYDEFVEECKAAATTDPELTVEIIADEFGDDYEVL